MKQMTRLSVAELKQLVTRPDVVEMHDVTARDPKLLVQLKAHRNTVPVPRHWCFKRKVNSAFKFCVRESIKMFIFSTFKARGVLKSHLSDCRISLRKLVSWR
jgi:Domain of unknown function (DUF382)